MDRLFVTPFCPADVALLRKNWEWAKSFGRVEYPVLLVADYNVSAELLSATAQFAAELFSEVLVHRVEDSSLRREWPHPQNHMFKRVAQQITWNYAKRFKAYFYLEPDVLPLRAGWADTLWGAYDAGGQPFAGILRGGRDPKTGKEVEWKWINGAAIYPNDLLRYSDAYILANVNPWDILSGPYVVPHATDLHQIYGMHFGTTEYHGSVEHFTATQTQHLSDGDKQVLVTGAIHPGWYLHHGCKDGSLVDLIRITAEVRRECSGQEAKAPEPLFVTQDPVVVSDTVENSQVFGQKPSVEFPPESSPKRRRGQRARLKPGWRPPANASA